MQKILSSKILSKAARESVKKSATSKGVNGSTDTSIRRSFISPQSAGLRKKWKDPAFRRKMSRVSRNNWKDPEKRKSITNAIRNRITKYWLCPEYRSRMLTVVCKAGPLASQALKNLWKNPVYREKMSRVSLNNWKNPEFIKIRISCAGNHMKKRWQNPVFREMLRKAICQANNKGPNKFEKRVGEFLDKEYPGQFKYVGSGPSAVLINGESPDFIHKKKKLIILANGAYWHCSPRKYKADYYHVKLRKTAKQIRKEDRNKIILFHIMGYRVIVIWEDEFNKLPAK